MSSLPPSLMFQGTGSDVGKSLLVAGLGRAFARIGLTVYPFKSQNMSNNAAVTPDGGEIGRAQALQARACRVAPSSDMNPILLKPVSENGSQLVLQGKAQGLVNSVSYQNLKCTLLPKVLKSYQRLANAGADLILIEGAGSAAEINLRLNDIANMGFAQAISSPVILVGDIDRGGVFASLVGTQALLSPADRSRLVGWVVNKFRGDIKLLEPGLALMQKKMKLCCLGVVPWFTGASGLPAEDAQSLRICSDTKVSGRIKIAIPRLSRIANFDDFDPLAAEPDIFVDFVEPGRPLPADAAVVIIPGSKSTRADLAFIKEQGWDIDILSHWRQRKPVLGICAGYQILGKLIDDPYGCDGPPGISKGLGLLAIDTVMARNKRLALVTGTVDGSVVKCYEMHLGHSCGDDQVRPFALVDKGGGRIDGEGACSPDGLVTGCYLHGLFANDAFRRRFVEKLGSSLETETSYEAKIECLLEALADHVEKALDLDQLLSLARVGRGPRTVAKSQA